MSMAEIMREVSTWSVQDQNQLMGYLLQLRHRRDPEWGTRMAALIDDRDESQWTSLDVLKEEFEDGSETATDAD